MTNGDVIKALFNPYKICEYKHSVHVYLTEEDFWKADYLINCHTSWWNAPYQPVKEANRTSASDDFTLTEEGQESVIDKIRAELIQSIQNGTLKIENGNEELFRIIDKYKGENKESATVAKFHDFYLEDRETWPPEDEEILIKKPVGDNFLAYLVYDDGEDGGWGFYSEDGDFIANLDEIDAWMPIPQHERDKNYIPIQERKDLDDPSEEKDNIEELEVEGVDFRCVFTYIGEGYNGNYDINDPEDEPLYRLDVYELDEEGEELRDEPSYSSCTTFSVRENPQTLMNYLETILEKLNENKEDIRNRKFGVEYVVEQAYNDILKAEIEQGEER